MKIVLIDNYDSFTWNLFHLIKSVCTDEDTVDVLFNDRIDLDTARVYDRIVISPGAGTPSETGLVRYIIRELAAEKPILGICLGHQAIAEVFGAGLYNIDHPVHGVKSRIKIVDKSGLFAGLDDYVYAGRYHSWMVSADNFPEELKIMAVDSHGNIMALSHCIYKVYGIQFHPESIMTECGRKIMDHFING